MKTIIPDISSQIFKEDTFNVLEKKYSTLGPMWVNQQMEWMNGTFESFKDHDKFLIVIFLIKKTLDFYSRNFIKLTYDEFYSKNTVEIEKFTISEVSKALEIPKETTRRKIAELENQDVIKIIKKKLIIDRSFFFKTKPIKSIERISRYLAALSEMCEEEKVLKKKITSEELQLILKNNFSYTWKMYYELQIPMMINYKKIFKDLESFHIFGICVVNQHLHAKKISEDYVNRVNFYDSVMRADKIPGINAMSLSDISGIPRATVIRKLKTLIKNKFLTIDNKKHYRLLAVFSKKLMPLQKKNIIELANFSTRVFNLSLVAKKSFDKKKNTFIPIKKYL